VGRRRETRTVLALLSENRLVTLTGPGGCGKTRLALNAAGAAAHRFAAGAWWCDLNPIADPALVPEALAAALGASGPVGSAAFDALAAAIGMEPCLVVLDNVEHLLSACAGLAGMLLDACPSLRFLATGLQPLGLPGERTWTVPPLPAPPPGSPAGGPPAGGPASAYPAVALFVARAEAAAPGFRLTDANAELVASICRRLEGLPLAIELAAARAGVLSLEQIDLRLANGVGLLGRAAAAAVPGETPRHRTLRATLAWGYDLLGPDEQRLLRILSVFPGSFTLEAAEAAWGAPAGGETVLDLAEGLVHKSMLAAVSLPDRGPARYRLLEPVRQFARELLEGSGEAPAARDRQLAWAAALAEDAEPRLLGSRAAEAAGQLEDEMDGLRAAMRWSATIRRPAPGLRIAGALFRFWFNRTSLNEGRAWLEELLHVPGDDVPPGVRARAAFAAGRLACRQGDDATAARRGAEALALARSAGDRASEARALDLLGLVAHDLNDFPAAVASHEAALAIRRDLGDPYAEAVSLNNLGIVHFDAAAYSQAALRFEEALEAAGRAGMAMLPALQNLAEIALARGDADAAERYALRGLALTQEQGNTHSLAGYTSVRGVAARLRGEYDQSAALTGNALRQYRTVGLPMWEGSCQRELGDLAAVQGDLALAAEHYRAGLEAHRSASWVRGQAELLARLALAVAALGDREAALAHAREALRLLGDAPHRHIRLEALEAAAVAWAPSEADTAALLLAAAEAERARLGVPLLSPRREWLVPVRAAAGQAGSPEGGDEPGTAGRAAASRLPGAGPAPAARRASGPRPSDVLSPEEATALALGDEGPAPSGSLASEPGAAPADPLRPAAVTALALGPARVVAGGREVRSAEWTYNKARELFFYLLDHPGAPKARIGVDLWPDASEAQLRNYFHRSLHFARRALGNPEAILFDGMGYRPGRGLALAYDVASFEEGVAETQALGPPGAMAPERRAAAAALLSRTLALWRGDYLEDLDAGEWAVLRREELRITRLQALLDLGQLHLLDAGYDAAASVYRSLLAEDPYLELAQRELMRCLARQGEGARALRLYHELRDLLGRELGAEPSYETTILFERIRRGDDV
jgi:predicted ATPase/DNA-binding SARP family transcriptional activator